MRTKNQDYFTRISEYIEEYAAEYGRSPTVREVAEQTGMSVTNAQRYIQDMKGRGMLTSHGTRGLQTPMMMKRKSNSTLAPVLSSVYAVPCGAPAFAEQDIEDYAELPASIFGAGEFFILPTEGDSMVNAGINTGDYVIVRRQNYADPGQVVVALIGDAVTLKRYCPEPELGRIRLQPANDNYEPIYTNNCVIQGVAVHVLKKIRGGDNHGIY